MKVKIFKREERILTIILKDGGQYHFKNNDINDIMKLISLLEMDHFYDAIDYGVVDGVAIPKEIIKNLGEVAKKLPYHFWVTPRIVIEEDPQ